MSLISKTTTQHYQAELAELEQQLADPAVYTSARSAGLVLRQRELQAKLELFGKLHRTETELKEAHEMLQDPSMKALAEEEIPQLEAGIATLEAEVKLALVPTDPSDVKNALIEIRAGAGGDESSIFAGDLLRMYARYCEDHDLKFELLSESPNPVGGYKEVIAQVSGAGAYGLMKYESGVHRVQRVPATESAGRIHTSTATVAVLPEAEEHEIEISPNDLRIDVYRSSGNGGQSVNTTDSAVRITHLPTGIVVTCQDEKSQLKNKAKAMNVLRSRLVQMQQDEENKKLGDARKDQIGTGDRSEKIRTYNYPQDRITDHRIAFTTHNIQKIMDGGLDELFTALHEAAAQKAMEQTD